VTAHGKQFQIELSGLSEERNRSINSLRTKLSGNDSSVRVNASQRFFGLEIATCIFVKSKDWLRVSLKILWSAPRCSPCGW
jgi:hypothetical protein